mmetsp:Transcript_34315/g.60062  ORF Transcript_34315/g.60062 Transcript_34315/m.60062 type:complete len:1187 (+) Transcript_34315:3689-7249(+)
MHYIMHKLALLLILLPAALAFKHYNVPSTGTPMSARQLPRLAIETKTMKLYVFGGSSDGSTYFDELWEFDISTKFWKKITPVTSYYPEARIAFCMFADNDKGIVYLFGGETELGIVNDLWAYDTGKMSWELLTTNGVAAPAITRFAHTSYRNGSNKLKLSVAFGETMVSSNKDIYELDVETLTWRKFTSTGDRPQVELNSEMAYYKNKLYNYGGRNSETTNDFRLYIYDFSSEKWTGYNTTNSPGDRTLHGLVVYEGYLYCLPGWGTLVGYDLKEVKRLDINTGSLAWETLSVNADLELAAGFPRDSYGYEIVDSVVYFAAGWRETGNQNSVVKLDLSIVPLKYEKLTDGFIAPSSRMDHSMHAIGSKLYLFGGAGLKGKLNDMWTFDTIQGVWEQFKMKGVVPEPRSGYSSCVVGDRIYLFGGQGDESLYRDFHIFDANSGEWSEVTGIEWPSPRKDACMVCSFPYFGIFGGITINGYDGDLHFIDLRYRTSKKLSSEGDSNGPGAQAHAECWALFEGTDLQMRIAMGESKGEIVKGRIFKFSLDMNDWIFEGTTLNRTKVASFATDDRILVAGGDKWGLQAFFDVFSYDTTTGKTTDLGNLSRPFYKGAYAYTKSSLYMHGGGDVSSKKYRSTVPSNDLMRLEMNEDCTEYGCDWPCSLGTYTMPNGVCEFCPTGTYNDVFGATSCKKCPVGTSSDRIGNSSVRQCYFCSEGTFNAIPGARLCSLCPEGYTCSVGNTEPFILRDDSEATISNQPKSYSEKGDEIDTIIAGFRGALIGIGCIIILVYIVLDQNKRRLMAKIDLYTQKHNHFIDEIMFIRARPLGGLFSVIFILIALIFVFTNLIIFDRDNIQETKALVPLVTLEEEYDTFQADITVILTLENYLASCGTPEAGCDESISISNNKISGLPSRTCSHASKVCYIEWSCFNCKIETGAYLVYDLQQEGSSADKIKANVTTSSSIPDEFSSIEQSIKSEFDTVFRGSEMNYLYFEMTPSVFTTDSKLWSTDQTGYHVAKTKAPLEGSVTSVYDVPETTGLRVTIQLDKSSAGLTTKRLLKQTLILLFSGILGSVFGIMSAIGGALQFVEKNIQKWKRRNESKRKPKILKSIRRKLQSGGISCSKSSPSTPILVAEGYAESQIKIDTTSQIDCGKSSSNLENEHPSTFHSDPVYADRAGDEAAGKLSRGE